ncbi:MAG: zinc ribbon domain-containing protein [Firmicutes bacterium]|nr:zinc ribbon domain-containing protein [Bacillota bacterium]
MFCTKCGKELYDGDRFCAHCGAEVRETRRSRYDDVVFNPPFKVEAQRRTEEILRSSESPKAEVKKETVSFDWNLDGFPSAQPRKTEAVDFNWDSVLEKKKESKAVNVEKIQPAQELFFSAPRDIEGDTKEVPSIKSILLNVEMKEPETAEVTETPQENEASGLTIEDLERELFGEPEAEKEPEAVNEPTMIAGALFGGASEILPDIPEPENIPEPEVVLEPVGIPESPDFVKTDEKFYTYNQKFDAFQELLEKEKERLKELEDSYKADKESMDYTWVGEVFPEIREQKQPETVQAEPEPLKVVDIVAPSLTMAVEVITDQQAEQTAAESAAPEVPEMPAEPAAEEPKEEVPQPEAAPSKEKLRYSDVFPRGLVNDDGTGPAADSQTEEKVSRTGGLNIGSIYDDIEEDDEPRRHIFTKIIIGILLVLILAEGVIIAAKFLAPESRLSLWANDLMVKAMDMILGGGEDNPGSTDDDDSVLADTEKDVHMESIIAAAAQDMETIGEAVYAPDVTFDMLSSYSFEEIPEADAFVDADWFTDENGSSVTYGQKLMESLVRYYDSWQAVNNDASLVGINALEIGEIRTGAEGFYALCRITYAGADGSEVVKYQTVYLKISDETMIINEIKEDNL